MSEKQGTFWKKIGLFLGGAVSGIIAFILAQRFSRRYRETKKQLQSAADELRNVTDELRYAQDLEYLSADESKRIGDLIERERAIVGEVGSKLADDENILNECDRKLREGNNILAECAAILKGISDRTDQI